MRTIYFKSLRASLLAGLATAAIMPSAFAQPAQQSTEAVVVTGTRIATTDAVAAAPLTVVSSVGIERTLVLVDGQRMVSTCVAGAQGQDLQNVPVGLIDRVEILRDGASPIYGADAI